MEEHAPKGVTLGELLRQQREAAAIPVRRLAKMAGISGPYLSQIERGLRYPSDAVLVALAKNLDTSADVLRARTSTRQRSAAAEAGGTLAEIASDPRLTPAQRSALIDMYSAFVRGNDSAKANAPAEVGDSATDWDDDE
ncbi:helix-turn-helix domain-containing protein [Kribbia dieselivorans]|uniref:helix-turn-helix domain-containing protein n=1 Tax=Kribbia dieselivorans TaxID=331526 RepID=UPI0009FABEC4|nr:helix-turn-helix transcriptional regulator [Kribbia dieselivorans]